MSHCPVAKDMMVKKLITLSPDTDVFTGIRTLLKHDISGAPVIDSERNYIGMFSEKCCMSVLTLTAQLARLDIQSLTVRTRAKDFMATKLVTLAPESDVFDAIELMLKHDISGAPVIDADGHFLGVFSERYFMKVLIDSAYDQLPTTQVKAFMNTDLGRIIAEDLDVLQIARIFLETPYRRLVVVTNRKVVGQISRRDVLRAQHILTGQMPNRERTMLENSDVVELSENSADTAGTKLESAAVSAFMDRRARTIGEETDFLSIAQIFMNTNYRRLPVLRDGRLVGQVSRSEVLRTTHDMMHVAADKRPSPMYLSALSDSPPESLSHPWML